MNVETTARGFEYISLPSYANEPQPLRLVGQSSAVGEYPDALEKPGSSFLWIGGGDGPCHHLSREQVSELAAHLRAWLETGLLSIAEKQQTLQAAVERKASELMGLAEEMMDAAMSLGLLVGAVNPHEAGSTPEEVDAMLKDIEETLNGPSPTENAELKSIDRTWRSDQRVTNALKERGPNDVMLLDCPECHATSYYNQGSRFYCHGCEREYFAAAEAEVDESVGDGRQFVLIANAYTVQDALDAEISVLDESAD